MYYTIMLESVHTLIKIIYPVGNVLHCVLQTVIFYDAIEASLALFVFSF